MRIRLLAFFLATLSGVTLVACTPPVGDRYAESPPPVPAGGRTAAATTDWTRARTVEIDLVSYGFTPDALHFREGEAYRLVLRNTSGDDHSFAAPRFFAAVAIHSLTEARSEEFAGLRSIAVPPSGERTLEFVAMVPGVYPLECDRPFHAPLGMVGEITIAAR